MGSRFLIKYILYLLALLGLLYIDILPLSNILNSFQIELISKALGLFLDIEGNRIIITPHYRLIIERDCNGLMVYYIFLATILALRAELRYKIIWASLGYITITAVNIFRIFIITNLVLRAKSNFYLAHDIFGNILLFITAISLFALFIKFNR